MAQVEVKSGSGVLPSTSDRQLSFDICAIYWRIISLPSTVNLLISDEEELLCLWVLTNLRVTSVHQMVVEELIFSNKLTHKHSPMETDLGF